MRCSPLRDLHSKRAAPHLPCRKGFQDESKCSEVSESTKTRQEIGHTSDLRIDIWGRAGRLKVKYLEGGDLRRGQDMHAGFLKDSLFAVTTMIVEF